MKKAHKQFKLSGVPTDDLIFSQIPKTLNLRIAAARKLSAIKIESALCSKPKNCWKYLAAYKATNERTASKSMIKLPLIIRQSVSDWVTISSHPVHQDAIDHYLTGDCLVDDDDDQSLDIPLISTANVSAAIQQLNSQSAPGIDQIPVFVVQGLNYILSPILASLIN